jgi:hypothetical protein
VGLNLSGLSSATTRRTSLHSLKLRQNVIRQGVDQITGVADESTEVPRRIQEPQCTAASTDRGVTFREASFAGAFSTRLHSAERPLGHFHRHPPTDTLTQPSRGEFQ